ncbi:MAG: hypothetical protein Q8N61_00100 [bacterium]|nr:hypothetical protein [bacterium]
MSKKKLWVFVGIGVLAAIIIFLGGIEVGWRWCRSYPPQAAIKYKVAEKKPVVKKKPPKKMMAMATVAAPPVIPAAPAPEAKLTLRLNVVEWSDDFEGRSPASSDIGPVIRKGLVEGTVRRSAAPITFSVNGAVVTVQGGQAVLDPGPIGPETAVSVRPLGAEKFVLPPGAQFPLTVGPEELDFLVKKGAKEIWLNFILVPR